MHCPEFIKRKSAPVLTDIRLRIENWTPRFEFDDRNDDQKYWKEQEHKKQSESDVNQPSEIEMPLPEQILINIFDDITIDCIVYISYDPVFHLDNAAPFNYRIELSMLVMSDRNQ